MGMVFYLVPTKLLLTESLPETVILQTGVQQSLLQEALAAGGLYGLCIGLFFGLITAIPRPPSYLSGMIGALSLIVTWIVAFARYGSHLKEFSFGHIAIFAVWLLITLFGVMPALAVWLGKLEPKPLLRPPDPIEG